MNELLCLRECLRFSKRHPRYLLILVMLYGASLRRWQGMRAARFGYAFLQLFDDLMDGDRASKEPPDEIAALVIAEWERGVFSGGSDLSRLGADFYQALGFQPGLPGDEPKADTAKLLRLMHEDARRRMERRISSGEELQQHLQRTFCLSLNLLMFGCGYSVRAEELPALVSALAWCSVVRDFADDAAKGLINVPREVLGDLHPNQGLVSMPAVTTWLKQQRTLGPGLLQACEEERERMIARDGRAAKLIGVFVRSMYKYCPGGKKGA